MITLEIHRNSKVDCVVKETTAVQALRSLIHEKHSHHCILCLSYSLEELNCNPVIHLR
jgi:hypothetical protein